MAQATLRKALAVHTQMHRTDCDGSNCDRSCPRTDITVQNEGSIFILTGRTDVGRDWIEEHCPPRRRAGGVGL
jgi:hypothetical protein